MLRDGGSLQHRPEGTAEGYNRRLKGGRHREFFLWLQDNLDLLSITDDIINVIMSLCLFRTLWVDTQDILQNCRCMIRRQFMRGVSSVNTVASVAMIG
jgi:hypothetical protein